MENLAAPGAVEQWSSFGITFSGNQPSGSQIFGKPDPRLIRG